MKHIPSGVVNSLKLEIKFALVSLVLGTAIAFFGRYAQSLNLIYTPPNVILEWQAASITSLAVLYPVTLLVFYRLGRAKLAKFRVGLSILVTYAAGFAGETFGQLVYFLMARGVAGISLSYIQFSNLDSSFTFLFVAMSGFAFAWLRSGEALQSKTTLKSFFVIASIALCFFFVPSFSFGLFELLFIGVGFEFNSTSLEVMAVVLLLLPVLQFLIFYCAGRKISLAGKPFRHFGFLFIGAYIGTVLGAIIPVALFGQALWTVPSNLNGTTMEYGIVFHNIPQSPLSILESLIPVQSLPFLAFFAMSLSRLRGSDVLMQDPPRLSD